ncbi:MAG: sulfotransferase family 2 domain-containing protein [Pseudomonadota bacterium]
MLRRPKRRPQMTPFKSLVAVYGSAPQLNHNLHVSPRYGFVYVTNPKVACSSTKATLNLAVAARDGDRDFTIASMAQVHQRAHNPLRNPTQVGVDVFNALMTDPSVFRFSFTREPIGRFCSAYLSKLDTGKRGSGMAKRLWAHMGWPKDYPLTLEEFAALCATDTSVRDFDPHWKLQRSQIAYDAIDYGFLGDHHRFNEDFAKVSDRIFGEQVEVFDTRARFQRFTEARKTAQQVSDTLRGNIEAAYAADFDMLAEIQSRGLNRMPS